MRTSIRRPIAGIGVAATLFGAIQFAAAASADASTTNDTVMTTTQRMSSNKLASAQVGTYGQGSHLNLVCYTHGQAVKGYYSKYIPGGWDNLWYQVSDGYWVADVDINTNSNNPVTPACATGTVMATTQRMAGPTLNTARAGSYNQGRLLGLSCYQRGQSVKGYYSKYIPGGWDNLWYRAADGYWVPDVDINTNSNNPVTGPCSQTPPPPAPPSSSNRASRAVAWANAQVGSQAYPGLCELFVEQAYNSRGKYLTAISAYYSLRAAGQIHTSASGIPVGALVFSQNNKYDFGNGHVMLSRGNGTFVSGGAWTGGGNRSTVQIFNAPAPAGGYLGWAYAPTSWSSR